MAIVLRLFNFSFSFYFRTLCFLLYFIIFLYNFVIFNVALCVVLCTLCVSLVQFTHINVLSVLLLYYSGLMRISGFVLL